MHKNIWLIVVILILTQFFYSCQDHSKSIMNYKVVDKVATTKQVRFIGHWLGEGKREKLVKDFVRQYSFQNQDVDIKLKFPEEIYFDRAVFHSNEQFIVDMITAEEPSWDIIRINDQYESTIEIIGDSLWPKKHLVDFSTIPEFVKNTRPELLTEELKNKRWGGIVPGPFTEGQFWALWSNKNVAQKVGVEIKSHGMTGDDLISYVKAVDAYNKNNPDDYITPIFESSDWQNSFWIAYQMFLSEIGDYELVENTQLNEYKLNAWHKSLKVVEELARYNAFNPNWESISWDKSKFDLLNEQCLFYSNGSWMYNIWEQQDPEKTMNCYPNEYPVINKPSSHYPFGYIIMWGVLKNSPNRDAAIDFLLAMNTPDISEMWVQYTKCPTGIAGKVTDVSFGIDQFEDFSNYLQTNYKDRSYRSDESQAFKYIGGLNMENAYYIEVITGKLTADEAIDLIRQDVGL